MSEKKKQAESIDVPESKELEALANLTLLQSGFDPNAMTPEEQKRRNLDERLRKIMDDIGKD